MKTNKILFVDDEPNMLMSLRRILRSVQCELDLSFAESATDALNLMNGDEFDVIVSDMRMPGMDGADLLNKTKELYPYTIRMMLTGYGDENAILRSVDNVHQFLTKPSEPAQLRDILIRASALHELVYSPELRASVSKLGNLPSIPETYDKLRKATINPDVSIADVSEIIEEDMGMSLKVLQLVNSAYFGLFQTINNVSHAVSLLGLDTIKSLVLNAEIFSLLKVPRNVGSVQKLWSHSMLVGECAKKIALSESNDMDLINNSYMAGLLHDIGKLVLFSKWSEKYEQALSFAKENNVTEQQAEETVLGISQSNIGAYLIGLWGLPGTVVEAVAFNQSLEYYPETEFCPALAVHAANALYYKYHPEDVIGKTVDVNLSYLQELGMDDKIDYWDEICKECILQDDEDE